MTSARPPGARRPMKKRDGRRADGLGLVPQWDASSPTVLFPSISTPRKAESPRCSSSQRPRLTVTPRAADARQPYTLSMQHLKRPLPQRPASQGAASPQPLGLSRDETAKYQFLPRKPTTLASPPSTPRTRSRQTPWPAQETWVPSLVVRVDAVVETIEACAQPTETCGETSHEGVLRLFLEDWLERFESEDINYRSIVVHAQVGFTEIQRLTHHMSRPNDVMTAFCCMLLDRLARYFGPYEGLVTLLSSEVQRTIYVRLSMGRKLFHETTYFTAVKQAQCDVKSRISRRLRCMTRNSFLEKELVLAQQTLESALQDWSDEVVKSCLYAWYEACVVRKKVLAKNLRWFSMWSSGSPRTLMASTFEDWRRFVLVSSSLRIAQKLQEDCDKVAIAQKNVTELSETNVALQDEYDRLREENRLLVESTQALTTNIEHAKVFLKTTPSREEGVCFDGQLRMEVVSEIAHYVLESLLRLQYNTGFHQPQLFSVTPDESCLEELAAFALAKAQVTEFPTVRDMTGDDMLALVAGIHHACTDRVNNLVFCSMQPLTPSTVDAMYGMVRDWQRQLEHYAAMSTLFYARHFEDHEASVAPPSQAAVAKMRTSQAQSRPVLAGVAAAHAESQFTQLQTIVPDDVKTDFGLHWRYLVLGRLFIELSALVFDPCEMNPYFRSPCISLAIRDAEVARLAQLETEPELPPLKRRVTDERTQGPKALPALAADCIVDSYRIWRDICAALVAGGVVQSASELHQDTSEVVLPSSEKRASKKISISTLNHMPTIRLPKRLPQADHCEPEPTSIYITGSSVASKKVGDFVSAKLRVVPKEPVRDLNRTLTTLHATLVAIQSKGRAVRAMHNAVPHARALNWRHACNLVTHKEVAKLALRRTTVQVVLDARPSLHTVIGWETPGIAALLQDEAEPSPEMVSVRELFQEHERAFRAMYTKPSSDMSHALSLDELWRVLKRMRIATKVVSIPKDDTTQHIPVVDLAEIVLRICNEQFGELYRLSRRVERFIALHLCHAVEVPSPLRDIASTPHVRMTLADHKEVLLSIFKSYAVKPKGKDKGVVPQHLTKREWSLLLRDYGLLTQRFSIELANALFLNVQDGALDEEETSNNMLYSEFCEAVVGLAGYALPDPFIDWPVKTALFIKRCFIDKPPGKAS
ncbi:hypothetical protein SPRG_01136 [Saprolegnia parasitica CBS 223.65]|uniref:Uncharacterized protein n=1 Tax=Saprolegnia parasitica (strain CBS 223.65) TaxID=695850 RepID=A0A067D7T5_SAPPC|nr:hypothetical protein SPRG_01136 [Saprolegnia parasitica CBS 223.65]KDO35072.1 hypothetical protein SPRG_01136 [Saprolegnia parasitica CBS 223.65]|eukprot:XP_012194725.1 hypothetical protein SPRG_01136 [Saprolegnia parasitica CBS 223.65]